MGSMRLVAGIVLYRPDPALLAALIAALAGQGVPCLVYVNGPLAAPAEAALRAENVAVVARAPRNCGLGEGLNALAEAASAAGHEALLLFDQDSSPPPGLAARLLEHFDRAARPLAAIGPLLTPPEGEGYRPLWYARRGSPDGDGTVAVDFLPTSGTLLSLAAWRAIGPFRADFFVDGIDVEWCWRAWSRGHEIRLAQDIAMPHRWGLPDDAGTPQILRQSALRNYFYLRNNAAMLRLAHIPLRARLRIAVRLAAQTALLGLRGTRASGRFALALRALSDGRAGRLGPAPADLAGAG